MLLPGKKCYHRHTICALVGRTVGRSVGLCERYEEQKEEQDTNQEEVTGEGDETEVAYIVYLHGTFRL